MSKAVRYAFEEAISGLLRRRVLTVVSIATIGASLGVFGLFFSVARAGGVLVESLATKVQVVIYLKPELKDAERAALASTLKDYGIFTLLWLVPLYLVLGLARLIYLSVSRRFEDAYDLAAAWGWNLLRLPGTLRRRFRAQRVRSVRDRAVRRFMTSSLRLPRWFERAEEFLDEGLEELEDEELGRPLPRRAASIAAGHPVLLGSVIAFVLGALAVRHFVGPEVLSGGALAAFPGDLQGFFGELVSGVRTTVLGGAQPASPSLAGMGAASWLAFGNTALAQKVLLGAMPPLAALAMYRAAIRETGRPVKRGRRCWDTPMISVPKKPKICR